MIGYFLKAGDQAVSDMFTPYVWNEYGFYTLFKKKFLEKSYGDNLKLLLIMYYVEGEFNINGPEHPKVANYSNKNKDINVAITVHPQMFHNKNEFERREFIIDSTLNAIKLVQEKLSKKKLDLKFDELIVDVTEIGNKYLKHTSLIG